MKRRNFLKGFLAATGTLAVAPAVALATVEHYGPSEAWVMLEEIVDHQMYINRLVMLQDYLIFAHSKELVNYTPVIPKKWIEESF